MTIKIDNSTDQIGIGIAVPNADAILDLTSVTKGLLSPRMTTAERTTLGGNLANVDTDKGMQVFDITTGFQYYWSGLAWVQFAASGSAVVEPDTQIVYGTGAAVDSSANFTFDVDTGQLRANTTDGTSPVALAAPGAVGVFAASNSTAEGTGGGVTVLAGTGNTTGAGGGLILQAGQGGATGAGGTTTVRAGAGGATSGAGGTLDLQGGLAATLGAGGSVNVTGRAGVGGTSAGGDVNITSGAGISTGVGGDVNITAGESAAGTDGDVLFTVAGVQALRILGTSSAVNLNGTNFDLVGYDGTNSTPFAIYPADQGTADTVGNIMNVRGGLGLGTGAGGALTLTAGAGGATGAGGAASLTGGGATAGAGGAATIAGGISAAGAGGAVNVTARDGVGTNQAGGDVVITSGLRTGSGEAGSIRLVIPTTGDLQIGTDPGTSGFVLTSAGALAVPTWSAPATAGTVTSVTVDGTAGNITSSGSPITSSGTITLNLATVSQASSGDFVKVTLDTFGRVSGNTAVVAGDITTLVDATYVNVSGDSMTSAANLTFSGGGEVLGLPNTPSVAGAAASKFYVDSISAGLDPKQSVRTATTTVDGDVTAGSFGGTYTAGGGPSATGEFTVVDMSAATGASIDGLFYSGVYDTGYALNDRILIKDQADAKQNGIYYIRVAASAADVTLTRSLDQDGTPANEVSGGNYTFVEDTNVQLVAGQDETSYDNSPTTEGTFTGGTGHVATDVLTMANGATITVDTVSSGVVTEFTVTTTGFANAGGVLAQVASTGAGITFTLTPDTGNIETDTSVHSNQGWLVVFDGDIVLNTDPVDWTQFSGTGAVFEPANQIVFGTGSSIDSDADFTYVNGTGAHYVNSINGTAGSLSVASPGIVGVFSATNTTATGAGGAMNLITGAGNTSGAGGLMSLTAGAGGLTGNGGAMQLTGGAAGATSGNGGSISLLGGVGIGAVGEGGDITLTGGASPSTGSAAPGGAIILTGGAATVAGGDSGDITINAGDHEAGQPGAVLIHAGDAVTTGGGGNISLTGGNSAAASAAGDVSIAGGTAAFAAVAGATTGGFGGDITMTASNGASAENNAADANASLGGQAGVLTLTGTAGGGANNSNAGATGTATGGLGTNVTLTAGDGGSANSIGVAGVITGGAGGSVTITAGTGPTGTGGGSQVKGADGVINLVIPAAGELQVNGDGGTVDQVLTSHGAAVAPTWEDAATLVNEPANQIVYGTGTGIDSDADFTYTSATNGNDGQFFVNTTTGTGSQGSVTSTTPAKVAIYGVTHTGPGTGGDVDIWGGYGTANGGTGIGGDVNIWGGFAGGANERGGAINLLGGAGANNLVTNGAVNITGGSSTTGFGGTVNITGGANDAAAVSAGDVVITGGANSVTGTGGDITITGGAPTDNVGSSVAIAASAGFGTNRAGGVVTIDSGAGIGSGAGGAMSLDAGTGGATGAGGAIGLTAGAGGATSGVGGAVSVTGGSSTVGTGGAVSITGGLAATTGAGGAVNVTAAAGVGGTSAGGNVVITAGAPVSTGTPGTISLATSGGYVYQDGGDFAGAGDAQTGMYVLRAITTNATPTEMFLNQTSLRMLVPSDGTWMFNIKVVARRTDGDGESAAYQFEGVIDNNAGTTALVGSLIETIIAEDTAAWTVSVTADDTADALTIDVTGEGSKNIRWVAFVRTVEVNG